MKPNIKNAFLIGGITIASALSSQAVLVYTTDFVGDEYTQNTGDIVFDNSPTTAVDSWFGTNNGIGIGGGDLSFSNSTQNRFRGAGIWFDTTTWSAGLVTVEFDVTNFVAGADTTFLFQAYAANGVDATNTVSLDLHGGASAGGNPLGTGTATISALGSQQNITANGTDIAVTFTYNGTDDFVALTFAQQNAPSGTEFGSADLDNLTVNTVPEPSSTALLGLGGLALIMRRRK
ncbi:MAG: PEP-CTERM sorting domain-containing protein [Akkermansiaceae bacterium]